MPPVGFLKNGAGYDGTVSVSSSFVMWLITRTCCGTLVGLIPSTIGDLTPRALCGQPTQPSGRSISNVSQVYGPLHELALCSVSSGE